MHQIGIWHKISQKSKEREPLQTCDILEMIEVFSTSLWALASSVQYMIMFLHFRELKCFFMVIFLIRNFDMDIWIQPLTCEI